MDLVLVPIVAILYKTTPESRTVMWVPMVSAVKGFHCRYN